MRGERENAHKVSGWRCERVECGVRTECQGGGVRRSGSEREHGDRSVRVKVWRRVEVRGI